MGESRKHPASRVASAAPGLSRSGILLAGLCLMLVGGLIFRDVLFGRLVLLYTDIGSDSVTIYYANFVHLSNYIRSQGFPSWSFSAGMGQDLAYLTGQLIWEPVIWLTSHLIAPALVYQHLAKVLVAGLFFFRFLQLRRLPSPAPLLGSLLLSFSAYMCLGSCWYSMADEVVCFVALLLGTELALQGGRWLMLAVAIALAGMITPFHLYLSVLFLSSYLPIRLFSQYGWQPRVIARICLQLAAVAALGLGLGMVVVLPCLHVLLHSPRGSGNTSAATTLISHPMFGLAPTLHYLTAALKPFANDLLGTGSNYRGWKNYLEAPATYCGSLCLLILPQVFVGTTRRHRMICTLFLVAIFVPTVFPWFRYLFWLFQGDYYRTYSLFWILGVISLSLIALSRYIRNHSLNLWLLAATSLALMAVLYLPFEEWQSIVNSDLRLSVTLFLLIYSLLLMIGQLLGRQRLVAWLIVGVSALELLLFDRISDRKLAAREEIRGSPGTKDGTIDALRDVIGTEKEKFFRVRKLEPSGPSSLYTLNDAMLFGYYGTSSYSSFNNVNYTNFLTALDVIPPHSESSTRWSVGLLNNPSLSSFACEKYALVDDPLLLQGMEQYELIKRYDGIELYRNTQFLPFGLTFDRYITEQAFLKLASTDKPGILLRAVVLSESQGKQTGLVETDQARLMLETTTQPATDPVETCRNWALKLTSFKQNRFRGNVFVDQRRVLVLQTPFDPGWRAFQDGQAAPVLKVDLGLLGVGLDPGIHKLELRYRNPLLRPALAISIASLFILGFSLSRWPRLGPLT